MTPYIATSKVLELNSPKLRSQQRLTELPSKRSLVLSAAPTGPTYLVENFPKIPTDLNDLLDQCAGAYDLDFRFFHVHARNPETGLQFSSLDYSRAIFGGIRRYNPDALVGAATSRKGEVELQILQTVRRMLARGQQGGGLSSQQLARIEMLVRASALEAKPDRITTFTPPEIKITNSISAADLEETTKGYSSLTRRTWKDPATMQMYYRLTSQRCRQMGIGEELELTTEAALPVIERIATDPTLGLPRNLFVLFLFGYSARLPINRQQFNRALDWVSKLEKTAGLKAHVTVGAAIAPHAAAPQRRRRGQTLPTGTHDYREVFEWVAEDDRVDSFRIGLEDVPELWGGQPTNLELALHARELCDEYGVDVITDAEAVRTRFGMDLPNKLIEDASPEPEKPTENNR